MRIAGPFPRLHEVPRLTRDLYLAAGSAYGVVFALGYSIALWGYDGALMASNHADLAWSDVILGFPLTLALCVMASRLSIYSTMTAVYIALWSLAGGVMGALTGWVPFDGRKLAVWLVDGDFWGLTVFPYDSSAATRTTLLIVIGVAVGAMAGIVERIFVELAVDWSDRKRGLGLGSFLLLLPCLPLALALAGAAHELMYSALRSAPLGVNEVLLLVLDEAEEEADSRGVNYAAVDFHRASLSRDYSMHTVSQDLAPPTTAVIDVEFDNGFLLRCSIMGSSVTFCDDLLPVLEGWMLDLVGARGAQPQTQYQTSGYQLEVDPNVAAWLANRPPVLVDEFEAERVAQRGGWIYMTVRSSGGLAMTCRFHGARPMTVDQCYDGGLH